MADPRFSVLVGDITQRPVAAIVNAANSSLLGGAGVDGAIHRAGGPAILKACQELRASDWPEGLPTGRAAITTAGDLLARYVIHTVGPVWRGGHELESELLAKAVDSCFAIALAPEYGTIDSIAFPAISTGVYGFPKIQAFQIITNRIEAQLQTAPPDRMRRVELVLFSTGDLEAYRRACP